MSQRSKFNVLARLFGRTENAVIGELYTHVLNTPLFVEPVRGEALLGAYLKGDLSKVYDGRPRDGASTVISFASPFGAGPMAGGKVAIMEIRGALTSRPMPGPSGGGPQNYEQLGAQLEELVEDRSVSAIVLRLDSPGGFASGLFDFTDRVFEAREKKPIVAVVDDIAFSAAYAIASAAEKIYVSRTGGVGSVGVVGYHVDQSAANESEGLKVTAVYAGAHKIDFSPHFPLSEGARERWQAEVDRLYGMFTGAVARYRGMKEDAVRATEALMYHGAEAVKAGLADKVGTLADALEDLEASAEERAQRNAAAAEEQRQADEQKAAEQAAAAEQARLVVVGTLAEQLLKSELAADTRAALLERATKGELTLEAIEGALAHAASVEERCKVASLETLAARFVRTNTPLETVGEELLEHKAELDRRVPLNTTPPQGKRPSGEGPLATRIYEARRQQAQKQ